MDATLDRARGTKRSRWEPWGAAGGLAFVALFALWASVFVPASFGQTPEAVASLYAEPGRGIRMVVVAMLLGPACFLLLWFFGSLYAALQRAEQPGTGLATLAFGAGIVCVVLLFSANAVFAATGSLLDGENQFARGFALDPNVIKLVSFISFWLAIQVGIAAAAVMSATSLVAARSQLFPKWLVWIGFIFAALNVFVVVLDFPFVLFLVWILVVAIRLIRMPLLAGSEI
jgi:hypothetical protein